MAHPPGLSRSDRGEPLFFNYRLGEGETLPDTHPLKRKGKRQLAQAATDLIPTDYLLCKLHRSLLMIDFLSSVLQQLVYRGRDPCQSLNISVMDEGACQQWHYDGGNMVTTWLLQEPEGVVFSNTLPQFARIWSARRRNRSQQPALSNRVVIA